MADLGLAPARAAFSGRTFLRPASAWDWICAAPLLILAILLFARPGLPLDDAYITLHNARTLLAGGTDPVYAGSTALTGATSAIHLVLIAILGLAMPLELASKFVTLAAILLYAAGLIVLLRRLQCPPAARAILLITGLMVGYMPYNLLNGLESGLAVAAIVWGLVLIDSKWLPLLCGTMPFVRPELAFLAAPLFFYRCWLDRRDLRRLVTNGALALAAASPWLIFYTVYTGWPIPNTGGAKVAFFAETTLGWRARRGILIGVVISCLFGPLWLSMPALARRPAGLCALVFLICWIGLTALVFPGGLHHNWFRYVSMILPVLLLGWAIIFARKAAWHPPLLALLLGWTFFTGAIGVRSYLDRSHTEALDRAAQLIGTKLPRDSVILVHDAGYLAWALPGHRLVDVVGLKSTASMTWHRRYTAQTGKRDVALNGIAHGAKAQYLVALADPPGFWGELALALKRSGWTLQPLSPVKDYEYVVYRIDPPGRTVPDTGNAAPQRAR
ncbi:hypothetical protein BDW16_4063 [Sphingomonas koreensis]|nr:hypothetical protein BDW16_4063 [Sphingomonas koreensis]